MAQAFVARGYKIISGGTDNHLMLIDLTHKGVTGKQAEQALVLADITVNKNMVPFDKQTAMTTSGIRVGSPAITTRGFREADCVRVVEWIDEIITQIDDASVIGKVRGEVNEYMEQFPLYDVKKKRVVKEMLQTYTDIPQEARS